MEFRRLQATAGGATYIISLPKDWVNTWKIKKGHPLAIVERDDGALVILPNPEIEKQTEAHTIERREESVEELLRIIIGKYVSGVYKIVIQGEVSWDEERELGGWVRSFLIGSTLSRESDKRLVITVATDEEGLPPKKVIRRAHNVTQWMCKESVSQITAGDSALSSDIISRDREVDRLESACLRSLNRAVFDSAFRAKVKMHRIDIPDHFRVIGYVESIADVCCELARFAEVLSKHKLDEESAKTFGVAGNEVVETLNYAMKAFFTRDLKMSNKAIDMCEDLRGNVLRQALSDTVPKQKSKEGAAALSNSLNSLIFITEATKQIGEINVDRCVR